MFRPTRFAAALLILPLALGAAAGADRPLSLVPAKVPVVIQVRNPKATRTRVTAMLQGMGPQVADAASGLLDNLETALYGGRELHGLAEDGRVLVLVTRFPQKAGATPPLAFLYQVDNFEALRDSLARRDGAANLRVQHEPAGLDVITRSRKEVDVAATTKAREANPGAPTVYQEIKQSTYLIQRGSYALVAPDEQTARMLMDVSRPLSQALSAELTDTLMNSDVGASIDLAQLRQAYEARFKQARMLLQLAVIMGMGQQTAIMGPELAKASLDAARRTIDALAQLGTDAERLVAGSRFEPAGLGLSVRTAVRPGSDTAGALKSMGVEHSQWLDRMPRGQQFYASLALNPELMASLSRLGMSLIGNFSGIPKEQMTRAMEAQARAGIHEMVVASTQGRGMRGAQVARYDHPKMAAEAQINSLKLFQSTSGAGMLPIKSVQVKPDAATTHGTSFTRVEIVWDLDKIARRPNGKLLAEQFRMSTGERVVQWIGATDQVLLSVMADSWESARRLIDDILDDKDTVGTQAEFRSARKRLPPEATLVAMIDLPTVLATTLQQIQAMQPGGGRRPAAPKEQTAKGRRPAYLAIAIGVRATRLDFDLWLPGDMVRTIRDEMVPMMLQRLPGLK